MLRILLILLLLPLSSYSLPKCEGEDSRKWNRCVGTYTMYGKGTFTFPNGSKYVGEYKNGKRDGKGTMTLPDGFKYVGEFKDGKMHGKGTYTLPGGSKYVGE